MVSVFTVLAATEETAGIAALGIDPWAILIQGTTFLIFLLIVKKFAFGKIVGTLEERRKTIEGSLDKAEELQKQNEQAEKRVNELLHEARLQAEDLIAKGRAEADGIVIAAQTEADTKAKKIIAEGIAKIDQQVEKAQDDLKKQTLELVAEATAVLLSEKIDAKKNNDLITKALAQANKENV